MAEISIIVPIYNVEKYLKRCIDSILNQTFSNFELILVDDGSTDSSGNICDEYMKIDSRIKVIHKKNEGQSVARNIGIELAKGTFIGFVDGDDYIDEDMYEYLYRNAIQESADVSMCELYHCYYGKDIQKHPCTYYEITDSIGAIHCVLESKITSVTVVNKLYKRALFNDIKFKKGITAEDAEIIIRILEKSKKVVISNEQKYYYFHRSNSTTTKPLNERDYDVVDVYDSIRTHALKLSPSLKEVTLLRQCWSRFYMLDKMMAYDGKYDTSRKKQYISFLKENKKFILKSDIFTKGRKIAFIALLINERLYKIAVRYAINGRKKINE